jgi:hypothetical protein
MLKIVRDLTKKGLEKVFKYQFKSQKNFYGVKKSTKAKKEVDKTEETTKEDIFNKNENIKKSYNFIKKEMEPLNDEKASKHTQIQRRIKKVLHHNSVGDFFTATNFYEELIEKASDKLSLYNFNQIISSYAPKYLMFKWFQNFKDSCEMYQECWKFKPKEVIFHLILAFGNCKINFRRFKKSRTYP